MYGGVLRVSRLDSRIGGIAHAGLGGVRIYKIGKPQNADQDELLQPDAQVFGIGDWPGERVSLSGASAECMGGGRAVCPHSVIGPCLTSFRIRRGNHMCLRGKVDGAFFRHRESL